MPLLKYKILSIICIGNRVAGMDDDIGEMVRSLYGPTATAAATAGPSSPSTDAAAISNEAAEKVTASDVIMTDSGIADGGGCRRTWG